MNKEKIFDELWSYLVEKLFVTHPESGVTYHIQFSTRGLYTILEKFDWEILNAQPDNKEIAKWTIEEYLTWFRAQNYDFIHPSIGMKKGLLWWLDKED